MRRRRAALAAGAALLALLLAGGAYVLVRLREGGNVRGSTVEFVTTQAAAAAPERGVAWQQYGYDATHRRAAPYPLAPPYRTAWTFRAGTLVEFPPVVAFGRLYLAANDGEVVALAAATGRPLWRASSGRCQAASPAVAGSLVVVPFLNRPPCNRRSAQGVDGELVAYDAHSGAVRWRRTIGPSESSPAVDAGDVFAADWTGRVLRLAGSTGRPRWTATLDGQVKGSPAVAGGRVFVGDYAGDLYALDEATGAVVWRASSLPRLLGKGTFYSTPAVAYGRVYLGSTDGKVYSYGAASGKLRWAQDTGGYVYSSPAVWEQRVYAGSYSGRFTCFDAATGSVAWTFDAHGPISGSPTVLDGLVYFATLDRRTFALDARTGREVWSFPDGKYSPVVADAARLYLVGYTRVYGLVPR